MSELPYVPARGMMGAKIVICTDCPSRDDVTTNHLLSGGVGKELDRILRESGISRESVWITSVSKYPVPPNLEGEKIPFNIRAQNVGIDVTKCLDELRKELQEIGPNVIIALGPTALWAFTGKNKIDKFRGSILFGMGFKVIPTYHPANMLFGEVSGYWQRPVMVLDIQRAARQSAFPEIRRPGRSLQICRNSAQLYDFIRRYENHQFPSIDIEALNCIPACIGVAFTRSEGITIPLWDYKEISDISPSDLTTMWIMLAKMLGKHHVVGQNIGYDRDKVRRLGFIFNGLHSDVMLKSFAINPELPKNLAFNTSIYTEEPYYKDEGMYEGSVEDLFLGCARDSCVTKEIDEEMDADLDTIGQRDYYENFILKLHDLYYQIEREGFKVNEAIREDLLRKYTQWSEQNRYNLFKIAGVDINVNSPKQVAVFLYESLKIPRRKGTGEEVLTALLNNVVKSPEHKRAIELILEKRRVDKTLGNTLSAPVDYDGRMRTSYFVCLETGRTSTSQLEPPIRPIVEYKENGKKKTKAIGVAFQTITKHGDIGADVRTMFEVDDIETEVFLQADSSQAEARVVALLANDEVTLRMYDNHDVHALTASWFFGGTERDYSKKVLGYESPLRFCGKTLRHAGHLGASKRRAAITVNTDARKNKINYIITEKEADIALKIFHQKTPNIQGVFHAGIVEALGKNRTLVAGLPYGVQSNVGGRRMFFERWGEDLNRQAFSYIPQRSISDNTKNAALRIMKLVPDAKIIVEAHDALLFRVKRDDLSWFAPIVKEEMERPISFATCSLQRHDLVVPCEMEIGTNYKDFDKYKI